MTWSTWRRSFEEKAQRPFVPVMSAPEIPAARRAALARTLAKFQLGEAGEGRIAREIDKAQLPCIDDNYRVALKLFVKEEGRHARLLASMVHALGGRLITHDASNVLFKAARRLMGLRFKILVLLAAELVGDALYGAVTCSLAAGDLARTLAEIRADERRHLVFHVAFLRRAGGVPLLRQISWLCIGTAASLFVLWDHRRALRDAGGVCILGERLARRTWTIGRLLGGTS